MAVIINELLCYMLCKIDSVPADVLVKLVSENFTDDEVETAKCLLCDYVDESIRVGNRRGQNKKRMNLDGIIKMIIECDRDQLPKFVALDLAKLPPITVDCIDVSALMRKQQLMDIELTTMKDMVQNILQVTTDTARKVQEAAAGRPPSADVTPVDASETLVKQTYADVVQGASAQHRDGEWAVANRVKRNRAPAPRPLPASAPAAAGSSVSAVRSSDSGTAAGPTVKSNPSKISSVVIGAKKHGSIRAVATVKRFSLFMSRLPPGTGGGAVSAYVREQTGAESVTAVNLPTRYEGYESYRIDILNPPTELDLLDPQLWAEGLIVRRFFQRRGAVGPADGGSREGM